MNLQLTGNKKKKKNQFNKENTLGNRETANLWLHDTAIETIPKNIPLLLLSKYSKAYFALFSVLYKITVL